MRPIDADALLSFMLRSGEEKEAWQMVRDMPTLDVEPVIYCKDCKYYIAHFGKGSEWCDYWDGYKTKPNDYCSHGVRINDGTTETD